MSLLGHQPENTPKVALVAAVPESNATLSFDTLCLILKGATLRLWKFPHKKRGSEAAGLLAAQN